jgi:hypothetical protein
MNLIRTEFLTRSCNHRQQIMRLHPSSLGITPPVARIQFGPWPHYRRALALATSGRAAARRDSRMQMAAHTMNRPATIGT